MESLGIGSVCTRATQITHGRLVRARGTPRPNQQIGSSLNLVCARSKTTGSTSSFTAISLLCRYLIIKRQNFSPPFFFVRPFPNYSASLFFLFNKEGNFLPVRPFFSPSPSNYCHSLSLEMQKPYIYTTHMSSLHITLHITIAAIFKFSQTPMNFPYGINPLLH
jgi:hypothetical protein